MKKFLYPCVIYRDEENDGYAVAFHDLGIYTEAETIERAYISAKCYLEAYCETAEELHADYPVPTSYLELQKKHPKDIIQLVYCEVGKVEANLKKVPVAELFDDELETEDLVLKKID